MNTNEQQTRREDLEQQMASIAHDLRAGHGDPDILRDSYRAAVKRYEKETGRIWFADMLRPSGVAV